MHPDHYEQLTKMGLMLMGIIYGYPFVLMVIQYVAEVLQ